MHAQAGLEPGCRDFCVVAHVQSHNAAPAQSVSVKHRCARAGQFGTRLQGGKDAAGARYIMTRLDRIARVVFHEHDDKLLGYLKEEGQSIEPQWCLLYLLNYHSTHWSALTPAARGRAPSHG